MLYLLHQTIDRSAERWPDKQAVAFGHQSLTYAQLVRQTNQLAQTLADQGVRRRDRVGIYLHKSLESAVAIYGVMKAGAAYVPLDPSAPPGRTVQLIRLAGIRHLITHAQTTNALRQLATAGAELECAIGAPPDAGLTARTVDWQQVQQSPAHNAPDVACMEQDLSYVMFTSGSTGDPKGIMHTHHSGLSYARWAASAYGLDHRDRVSNHAPLHFDLSTFDFFAGALAGAATVIVPEEVMKLPASYSKWLQDQRISVFFTVPFALIQLLLRGGLPARDLGALRWVIFGGEPFPTKHLRDLMGQLPKARFSNMYGPAEVNGCTFYHVPILADDTDEPIPIGQLCPNMEALVVADDDQLVTAGEIGQLLIRSPTMMQGYWNRPDLNARAFYRRGVFPGYEDVFYRTGDLVQRRADGHYQFLGRQDRQIKARGYRVELDEVETALLAYDEVVEAAVFSVPDGQGSHRIEAAAILSMDGQITPSDLTKRLSQRLPWYAVPVKITIAQAFPRTSTGKIDRRLLQEQALAANR